MPEKLQDSVTLTGGSYSGIDIRIYAVISGVHSKEWQDNKDKIIADYANDMTNIAIDQSYNTETDQSFYDNTSKQTTNDYHNTINYLDKQSSLTYQELGEVQTLSYSVYRDKQAVNVLGKVMPNGFTRGQVTVAGTIIFTVLYERILHEIINLSLRDNTTDQVLDLKLLRVDELPPLDIFVTFQNEYGNQSRLGMFGVEFMNEGQVMSVSDLITENSVNYVARYMAPMRRVDGVKPDDTDLQTSTLVNSPSMPSSTDYTIASNGIDTLKQAWL